ncbi:MAG TPA: hypothetical protein VKA84_03770, partial [Gemmatimonadaceae bacterium]|nr:hypothetical protein [Gemmatimonadaceae bacterium]
RVTTLRGRLSMVGKLVRRTLNDDQPLAEWSASDLSSYEAAVAVFQRELDSGYSAVRADGATHQSVTELPRDAELVILATAMGGG